MAEQPKRALVVDDDESMCAAATAALEQFAFTVSSFTDPRAGIDALGNEEAEFDVVLSDVHMEVMNGFEFCERVVGARPGLPVIMLTGETTLEAAVSAMRAGAYDFLTKPLDPTRLQIAVDRAVQYRRLQQEVVRLRREVASSKAPPDVVGDSASMKHVYDLIRRVSASDASVLVCGQTGTGKELIARAIHAGSPRSERAFVAVNCAAVPATLIESELFGHAKGAFTDARVDRKGLFLQADGGTLFLDEIGELPLDMQPKLLRALQERRIRPVGSDAEIAIDVRIVAATNRDLEREVFEKRFREDLFYRLNVVQVDLPPLKSRGHDVLALAQHFLVQFSRRAGLASPVLLSRAVAEKLLQYEWPGNVRELENCMERAVALSRLGEVSVEDLPERVRAFQPTHFVVPADDAEELVSLAELESRYIARVLKVVGDNKTRAAQILGVDRRTLYRRAERAGDAASGSGKSG